MRKALAVGVGLLCASTFAGAFPVFADSILYVQPDSSQTQVGPANGFTQTGTISLTGNTLFTSADFYCSETAFLTPAKDCVIQITNMGNASTFVQTSAVQVSTVSDIPRRITTTFNQSFINGALQPTATLPAGEYSIKIFTGCSGCTPATLTNAAGNIFAVFYGEGNGAINWSSIYFPTVFNASSTAIATSSGLWQSLQLASSTIQCETGNIFSSGICQALSFLFVPDPSILQQYVDLFATSSSSGFFSRFPASYAAGISGAFGSLSASSTGNAALLEIDFSTVDPATSTPFGPLLPDAVLLSTSTIARYYPDPIRNTMNGLIGFGLWLALATDIFFTVRNRMHRV